MMTLSKIAELAHVSVSTASKAFSGSEEISKETRDLVFAVAKKHGCLKKFYKKDFYFPVVAVVCPEIDGIYARALSYISRYLDDAQCKISISTTHYSVQKKRQLMEFYSRHSVADGVIIIDYKGSPELPHTSFFPADYSLAANLATGYFKEKGIENIVYAGWDEDEVAGEIIANKDAQIIAQKLLKNLPDAVVCRDDFTALGVIKHLTAAGVKIPEDVAVMGVGNAPEGELIIPELSTVDFKLKENCRKAVDEILGQIDGEKISEPEYLPPEIIIRQST